MTVLDTIHLFDGMGLTEANDLLMYAFFHLKMDRLTKAVDRLNRKVDRLTKEVARLKDVMNYNNK